MNKSKWKILCPLLFLVIPLSKGCSGDSASSGTSPKPAPVSPELTFSIFESGNLFSLMSGDSMRLLLSVQTIVEYPCYNYEIPTDISFHGYSIIFTFAEPRLPGLLCFDAFGPATSNEILPHIEGSHLLSVNWNGNLERYLLIVSDELISLTPLNTGRTVPLHLRLWRYPKNSVEVHCSLADSSTLCDQLFLSLQSISGLEEFEFGATAAKPFYRGDRFYIYESDEALSVLDSIVTHVRQQVPGVSSRIIGSTIWLDDINWNMFRTQ